MRVALQILREAQRFRGFADQSFRRFIQQPLAGAIHEPQSPLAIESEYRDVDLFHHLAQKRRRFHSAQPLLAQRGAHRVHLLHHFAQRIVASRVPGTDGIIPFAHRFQQIRERSQGRCHALAQAEAEAQPYAQDQRGQRPLNSRRIVT